MKIKFSKKKFFYFNDDPVNFFVSSYVLDKRSLITIAVGCLR
jgi:hypothetical protein